MNVLIEEKKLFEKININIELHHNFNLYLFNLEKIKN